MLLPKRLTQARRVIFCVLLLFQLARPASADCTFRDISAITDGAELQILLATPDKLVLSQSYCHEILGKSPEGYFYTFDSIFWTLSDVDLGTLVFGPGGNILVTPEVTTELIDATHSQQRATFNLNGLEPGEYFAGAVISWEFHDPFAFDLEQIQQTQITVIPEPSSKTLLFPVLLLIRTQRGAFFRLMGSDSQYPSRRSPSGCDARSSTYCCH